MDSSEARLLTDDDHDAWDRLVEQSACGTVFHSSLWITTTARTLGLDFTMIGAFEDDQLVGGCVFYKKKKSGLFTVGTTRILLSPYGGFLLPDVTKTKVRSSEGKRRRIVSAILDEVEKERLLSVMITGSPNLVDLREFLSRGWTEEIHYTYVIPLDGDIFSSLDGSVRKVIRKAAKLGIVAAPENDPQAFWRLISMTFEKQGLSVPYNRDHLFGLVDSLRARDQGEVWIARTTDGDPVSSAFVVNNSRYAHGLIAASDPSLMSAGANSLLQFTILQDLQQRGFDRFEIWGATAPRLAAYYSSFNPELVPYYAIRKGGMQDRVLRLMRAVVH